MLKKYLPTFLKNNLVLVILLFLGTLTWSLTMVKSGWQYDYGLGFWGANGHDGIWHVALAESLSRGSRGMPVFAGEQLQNYHLGFDLTLAGLNKLTGIRIDTLYFQILPPILAFLIGLLTYVFTLSWTKSKRRAFWSTFFVYFGGSFAWVLGKGESAFWSQQAISTLINPPFALSLIFILLGLICLQKKKYFLSILFFGVLIQIKVYAGILVLIGLFISKNFKVFLSTLLLSLMLFLPSLKNSAGLLVWQPFWFLETMMGLSDRIGWTRFYSAMTTYRMGGIWIKAILAYGAAFVIFVIGNFGTRIVFVKQILKKLDAVKVFMLSIIFAGTLIPIFFLQKGTPWNTIQFFYYSLFFSAILAGIVVSQYTKYYILYTFVLLTIPTTLITLKDVYLPNRPPAMLSSQELEGLRFLAAIPDGGYGFVLTHPFDKFKAKEAESNPPRPLYLYDSTAYVAAFSKHPVFLEDEVNLNITGYDWRTRRAEVEAWYQEKDQSKAREFLKQNKIKYLYWIKPQRAYLGEGQLGLEKIFENKEVEVYMVKSI
jgi:hypothetical protein